MSSTDQRHVTVVRMGSTPRKVTLDSESAALRSLLTADEVGLLEGRSYEARLFPESRTIGLDDNVTDGNRIFLLPLPKNNGLRGITRLLDVVNGRNRRG